MRFLDEAETSSMSSVDLTEPSNYLSTYDDAKSKMLNLSLELDEANKTVESLKSVVSRQKMHIDERETAFRREMEECLTSRR
jgi:CHASE3 domain sensor protein